jgi:hypothetical protein
MRRSVYVALTSIVLTQIAQQPVVAQGQSRGATVSTRDSPSRRGPAPTGTARVTGRVTAADTGERLRNAQVLLVSLTTKATYTGVSDESGAYLVSDLPHDTYTVRAQKLGFLAGYYGAGKRVEVLDGQAMRGIDVSLRRGGVITGAVTDELGAPAVRVDVTALRQQFLGGRWQFTRAGSAMSDDRGEFRLFNLAPGEYYLLATLPNPRSAGRGAARRANIGYVPTYYPGTVDASQARPIDVSSAQATQISLSLVHAELATVAGHVIGGRVRGGVQFRPTTGSLVGVTVSAKPDGSFFAEGLAPGSYTLMANVLPDGETSPLPAQAAITVASGDVASNVVLQPQQKVRISGRVTIEPEATGVRPDAIRIGITPADFTGYQGGQAPATVRDDFSFSLEAWPGRGVVRLLSNEGNVYLKSVRFGGVDISDTGLEVPIGEQVSGLDIELTRRPTTVSGTVVRSAGTVDNYTLVIFSQSRERWRALSGRHVAVAKPDQLGRFVVRGLPPGDYYAFATEPIDGIEWRAPSVLEGLTKRATSVTLRSGDAMDIRVPFRTFDR